MVLGSGVAMVAADSTQGESATRAQQERQEERQDKRKRRILLKKKLKAKARAKLAKLKKSQVDSDVSDHDSDLDLDKPLLPISGYIREREVMLEHMFRSISRRKLKAMLPEILKTIPVDELKKVCLEQVEMMSKKRISRILQGDDPDGISSSGTEEDEESEGAENRSDWEEDEGVVDSTSRPAAPESDQESQINTLSSQSDASELDGEEQYLEPRVIKSEPMDSPSHQAHRVRIKQEAVSEEEEDCQVVVKKEPGLEEDIMELEDDGELEDSDAEIAQEEEESMDSESELELVENEGDLEDGEIENSDDDVMVVVPPAAPVLDLTKAEELNRRQQQKEKAARLKAKQSMAKKLQAKAKGSAKPSTDKSKAAAVKTSTTTKADAVKSSDANTTSSKEKAVASNPSVVADTAKPSAKTVATSDAERPKAAEPSEPTVADQAEPKAEEPIKASAEPSNETVKSQEKEAASVVQPEKPQPSDPSPEESKSSDVTESPASPPKEAAEEDVQEDSRKVQLKVDEAMEEERVAPKRKSTESSLETTDSKVAKTSKGQSAGKAAAKGKAIATNQAQKSDADADDLPQEDDDEELDPNDEIFGALDMKTVVASEQEDGVYVSKNQMEILELEMRARAIKAMLKVHEEIDRRERLLKHQEKKLKQQQTELQKLVNPVPSKYAHLSKLEKAQLLAEKAKQQSDKAKVMKAMIAKKQAEKLKLNVAVQKTLRTKAKDKDSTVSDEKRQKLVAKVLESQESAKAKKDESENEPEEETANDEKSPKPDTEEKSTKEDTAESSTRQEQKSSTADDTVMRRISIEKETRRRKSTEDDDRHERRVVESRVIRVEARKPDPKKGDYKEEELKKIVRKIKIKR